MDYRRIIRSRKLRIKILSYLDWVPDRLMLPLQYWLQTGRKLNLRNPKRFTEKLQIYKMKYRNPNMLRCTDKYEVRDFISEKGLSDYLIPLIGIYDSVNAINFESLPEQFVAKTTDGGGGNQVFVCKDKSKLTKEDFYSRINQWGALGNKKNKSPGREWAYENGFPRRIIIEELVGDGTSDLIDYKFFCFHGKVAYVYGISDRKIGQSAQLGIYNTEFKKLDVDRCDERHQEQPLPKPPNYEEMLELAKKLSEEFPHVRVDLYNVSGRIYFGELTFYDGSGYMSFRPDSFDEELGSEFDILKL